MFPNLAQMLPALSNPPHPSRLVKENIEGMGLTVAQAAEGLGVTR